MSKSIPSPCQEALTHLYEYIDCEMTQVDIGRLRAHINECETCQAEVGLEQKLRSVLKRSCIEEAPEHLRARVLEQITVISQRIVIERQ